MTNTATTIDIDNTTMQETATRAVILDLLRQSHFQEQNNAFKESLDLIQQAWQFFESQNTVQDNYLKAEILHRLCQLYLKSQNFQKLSAFSEALLEVSRELDDSEKEVQALTNLGICRSVSSDYKAAMPLFVEALDKSRYLKIRHNEANCLINIGTIYANLFNYEEALERYRLILTDYEDVLTDTTRIIINLNTGNLYFASEQFKRSVDCCQIALQDALSLEQFDKVAHAHALISRSYLSLNDINKAIHHARQSADFTQKIKGHHQGRAINHLNMAQIAVEMKDTEGGITLTKRGIALARRFRDDTSELRGFALLATIFKKINDLEKALRCQEIYARLQADYLKMQRNMRALDVEIKYALREKERQIAALLQENRYQALLLERNSQIERQNEQLRKANEELQQFAYISSHDLKEPLRMVGSFAQVIERQYADKLGEESKQYFHFINEGVSRMNGLLDALLQYATIGKADIDLEPVDMNNAVRIAQDNLQLRIRETGATIEVPTLPTVKALSSFMTQLFQNLIGNALKFRQPDVPPHINIGVEEKANEWLFSVQDNGIGISPEHRERIFVIFQRLHTRSKYEGTGIGLAICHKIILQLKGQIWVESAVGSGATFLFTIPK
jgi:signal transduction histidine kinase